MTSSPRNEDVLFSLDRLATVDEHGAILRSGVQLRGTRAPVLDARRADVLLREALVAGDLSRARQVVRAAFADDVYGLLFYVTGEEAAARRAYSTFYRSLAPSIADNRSLRSWVYASVLHRVLAENGPRGERVLVPLPGNAVGTSLRVVVDIPSLVIALRTGLSPQDRALLALRVDRKLTWPELAHVFLGPDAAHDSLPREARRLRRRLTQLRKWVVRMAASRGVPCVSQGDS